MEIRNISVGSIYAHPDNPRKDLGDLTELTNSIRVNGLLQNLTVISGHWTSKGTFSDEEYTVLMGHRRLAAAKLAGLDSVPCFVHEPIGRAEQIALMFTENANRNDFTIVEQAQSVQLMCDLGMSAENIAKESGLNVEAVNIRLKLAKLDQKKLEASWNRGGTLMNYAQLDKIEDTEMLEDLLDYIGTPDYEEMLESAIKVQEMESIYDQWMSLLPTFAERVDTPDYRTMKSVSACRLSLYEHDCNVELTVPDDVDTVKYQYQVCEDRVILLKEKKASETYRHVVYDTIKDLGDQLLNIESTAEKQRVEFIKNLSNAKSSREGIMKICINYMLFTCNKYIDEDKMRYVFGLDETADTEEIIKICEMNPDKGLLAAVYFSLPPKSTVCYWNWDSKLKDFVPVYVKDDFLEQIYAVFEDLGYEMSDDEKKMLDGTHELFSKILAFRNSALKELRRLERKEKQETA